MLIFIRLVYIYFRLSVTYGTFSSNLAQKSTIFISLVAAFVVLQLALGKLQYVSQYIVMNTNIAYNHSILAFLLHFSVALATYISLASHAMRLAKLHSQCDIGPLRAGLYLAHVIQGWLCTWAELLTA